MIKRFTRIFNDIRVKAPLCLFIFIFSIYILTFSGVNLGDGLSVFLTTRAIVNNHSLIITSADFKLFSSVISNSERGGSSTQIRDGNQYMISGILMSVLAAPLYFIGSFVGKLFFTGVECELASMVFFSLFNPLILSLISLLIYFYLRINKEEIGKSLAWSIFFALTTFAWAYAKTGFYEPLMALLIFLTFFFLFLFKYRRKYIFVMIGATIYGISFFAKGVILIFLPIYIFYLIFMPLKYKEKIIEILVFVSIISVFFIFYMIFNYSIYGDCLGGGYSDQINSRNYEFFVFSIVHFINSSYGFLFSPGKGIIFYTPLMFLFFSNIQRYISNMRQEDVVSFSFFVIATIFYSFFYTWSGGGDGDRVT